MTGPESPAQAGLLCVSGAYRGRRGPCSGTTSILRVHSSDRRRCAARIVCRMARIEGVLRVMFRSPGSGLWSRRRRTRPRCSRCIRRPDVAAASSSVSGRSDPAPQDADAPAGDERLDHRVLRLGTDLADSTHRHAPEGGAVRLKGCAGRFMPLRIPGRIAVRGGVALCGRPSEHRSSLEVAPGPGASRAQSAKSATRRRARRGRRTTLSARRRAGRPSRPRSRLPRPRSSAPRRGCPGLRGRSGASRDRRS